ncbi:MAG: MBL fold metallo-hydrolase [Syntrophorhabdales bacterium]|jgi:glyoxylase-like metal-dependent hydrolase (beta-lactamase superfamily II)
MRIYRVAGSDITDPRDCSVYLLDVGELVMIDAGFGESIDLVVSHVKEQGLNPRDISTVILTHCHVDHIGGADQFCHRFGSRLVMHKLDAEIVARGDERLTAAFCFQKAFRPFPIDLILSGEEQRLAFRNQELVCLHTPGHTPGSISVYAEAGKKRVLFAQDLGAPLLEEFDCDPVAWRSSAEKLLALNADMLCDGHTGVYQPRRMVRKYIESCMASNLGERGNPSS